MEKKNYDSKKISSLAIKKVIDEQSAVAKTMADATAEIESLNKFTESKLLEEISIAKR